MNKILIFERNTFIKDALRNILQVRFPEIIIKEVISFERCVLELKTFEHDIIFIGTAEPNSNRFDQFHEIRLASPGTAIILFTEYDINEYRKMAIMEGANYVISKEWWTGSEILALVKTIFSMNNFQQQMNTEKRPIEVEEEILRQPLERRSNDWMGRAKDKEFLTHNPDRRSWS